MSKIEKLFNLNNDEIISKIYAEVSPYEGYIAIEFSNDRKTITVNAVDRDDKLIKWAQTYGYNLKNCVDFDKYTTMIFYHD